MNNQDPVSLLVRMFPSADGDLIQILCEENQWDLNPVIEALSLITGQQPKDTTATKVNIFEPLVSDEESPSNLAKNTNTTKTKHSIPDPKRNADVKTNGYIPPQYDDNLFDDEDEFDHIEDESLRLALKLQKEEEMAGKRSQEKADEDEMLAKLLQNQELGREDSKYSDSQLQDAVQKATEKVKKSREPEIVDPDDGICVVCMFSERKAVFVPCAHRCCCKECANKILNVKKVCPLCWTDLEGVI